MPAIGVVFNLNLQSALSPAHIGRIPNLVSLDAAVPYCVYGMHLQGLSFQEATWDHVSIIFSSRHLHECADTTSSRLTLANIVRCRARLHAIQPHCVHSQGLPYHERCKLCVVTLTMWSMRSTSLAIKHQHRPGRTFIQMLSWRGRTRGPGFS